MMSELALSIDCGTQSLRALLFDSEGHLLDGERVYYTPYYSLRPGWTEQDPDLYWRTLIKAVKKVVERNQERITKIIGMTVTTQRATLVLVGKDGLPLRAAIVWLDQRKARFDAKIPLYMRIAHKFVGMDEAVRIVQMDGKVNWVRQNEPEVWKKTSKVLLLSGYLNYRLTERFVDSVASQIGHIPFDYKRRRWATKNDVKYYIFPVEKEKLPDLVEPSETIGYLSKDVSKLMGLPSSLPVIASGSDKGCETLGLGVLSEDKASLSFGTTATIQVTTKRYFEPIKYMPAYPALIPGYYNPEVEIFRGFWMITWFKEEFGAKEVEEALRKGIQPEELFNSFLKEVPAGSLGLIVQPYWTPGLKMPEAKGAMIGFGSAHRKPHMYKAIIEGLGFALLEGLRKIEKRGKIKVKEIMIAGGASQSTEICQIVTDIFNLPAYRGETHETAGLGSAIPVFVGLGVHKTFEEAVSKMVRYRDKFEPDPENARLYRRIFEEVYSRMYSKLKPLYKKIREITNYPEKI